jgi:hypothetical protein
MSLDLFLRFISSRNLVSNKWEVSPCWCEFCGAIVPRQLIFSVFVRKSFLARTACECEPAK